jgi:hypothetical protein
MTESPATSPSLPAEAGRLTEKKADLKMSIIEKNMKRYTIKEADMSKDAVPIVESVSIEEIDEQEKIFGGQAKNFVT